MNITPEILKVIAEGMGYEPFDALSSIYVQMKIYSTEEGDYLEDMEYNPLTNAEQCMEIIQEMGLHLTPVGEGKWRVTSCRHKGHHIGETIYEAVVLAAYEYFKEK